MTTQLFCSLALLALSTAAFALPEGRPLSRHQLQGYQLLQASFEQFLLPDEQIGKLINAILNEQDIQFEILEDQNDQNELIDDMKSKFGDSVDDIEPSVINVEDTVFIFPRFLSLAKETQASLLFGIALQRLKANQLKMSLEGSRLYLSWAKTRFGYYPDLYHFLARFFGDASVEITAAGRYDLAVGTLKHLVKNVNSNMAFPDWARINDGKPQDLVCLPFSVFLPQDIYDSQNPEMLRHYYWQMSRKYPNSQLFRALTLHADKIEVFTIPRYEIKSQWDKSCIQPWKVFPYEGLSAYKRIRSFATTTDEDLNIEVGLILER